MERLAHLMEKPGVLTYMLEKPLTDLELMALSESLRPYQVERYPDQRIVVMSPASRKSARVNSIIVGILADWCEAEGSGESYESSIGYTLPDGSTLSPDVSWIRKDRLPPETAEKDEDEFIAAAPDFAVEICSKSNWLGGQYGLLQKMERYIQNGVRLGWIIDPFEEKAYIFKPGRPYETIPDFTAKLSGEEVMPGFVLDLAKCKV